MTDPFAAPPGDQPPPPSPPVYASPPPYGAPSQPPPPSGAPLYGTPLAPQGGRNGLGTASLVLGVLALVSCWTAVGGIVLGIVALVLGVLGRRRAKRSEATNGGVALAGAICGGLGLLAGAGFLTLWISILTSPEWDRLIDCLDAANGDSAATRQCEDAFFEDFFDVTRP